MDKAKAVMKKYEIGTVKDYKEICRFDSPFAKALLSRVKEKIKGKELRDSMYAYTSCLFFYFLFISLVYMAFTSGHIGYAFGLGLIMSLGHLAGHAGNHWAVSKYDFFNRFMSMTCTSLWGLREKNWEFSHLISHHCYNYTDRDYIMEQHVPFAYFRVRDSDPWKPIHKYQHYLYLTTPITAFFLGALRLDCAPWIFVSPFLSILRRNRDSPMPAPQFFASGSNVSEQELVKMNLNTHDGVGPDHFLVQDSQFDNIVSLIISNIVWLPLFLYNVSHRGLYHAILFNSVAFGFQAALVTKSLLTQHMCEDIKLQPDYAPEDCWYSKQIESSTTINKHAFFLWFQHAISYQTEHHMFPCMNAQLLVEVQPIVQQTAKEFGLQYNYIENDGEAIKQVFKQFKKMSVKPDAKKE
jgi:linoleoyl-CoA desaturase